jgi:hypothetical protein
VWTNTPFLQLPFYTKRDHFTKAGSGQTQGELKEKSFSRSCIIAISGVVIMCLPVAILSKEFGTKN